MVDFKKLMNETPEEREARQAEMQQRDADNRLGSLNDEYATRALRSTKRLSLTVDEYQYRTSPSLEGGVIIHGTTPNNERVVVMLNTLYEEDGKELQKRMGNLACGDKIVVDGDYEARRWKDNKGAWHTSQEFQALMPVIPACLSLSERLPQEVKRQPSAYSVSQQMAASRGISH